MYSVKVLDVNLCYCSLLGKHWGMAHNQIQWNIFLDKMEMKASILLVAIDHIAMFFHAPFFTLPRC